MVSIVNKGAAKDPTLSHLAFIAAIHDIRFTARHFLGVQNKSADALSRNRLQLFFSHNPQAAPIPVIIPPELQRAGVQSQHVLDITQLDAAVDPFLGSCIASSTCAVYRSAQRQYTAFCLKYGVITTFPLQEDILCRYIAFLVQEGLKHRSIKSHSYGIRCLQI